MPGQTRNESTKLLVWCVVALVEPNLPNERIYAYYY